ncbi:MAG: DUF4145 domain-containing protein [Chloroflexi bacterium]|nr:DUF4145 domain-containing protein [Chloroflexota bacterium]
MPLKSVKCPHCAVMTAIEPVRISGSGILHERSHDDYIVKGEVSIGAVVQESNPYLTWVVAACLSCDRFFVAVQENGRVHAIYPLSRRPVADAIPMQVRIAFEDALLCMAAGALGGCLMMCRTTLERMERDKGASSLRDLRDRGLISPSLFDQADEARRWSNMVGHDPVPLEDLKAEDCEELVEYVEALLDALYVQPAKLAKHRKTREDLQGHK